MKKFRNVKYIALLSVLLLSIALAGCSDGGNSAGSGDVVAKVGDEEITEADLNDVLVERYGAETLNTMISETIIEKEVDKADIEVSEEEIEEELENMAAQYGGMQGLQMAMQQAGLEEENLKEEIETNIALEKLLEPEMDITDEAMKEYYEENKADFKEEEQVKASHILVETEEEAEEIAGKLEDGEDFAELAKENSIDPGSKEEGGDLGYFAQGQMVKEFNDKAFSMEVDEISEPVETENGFHIILLEDKKEAKTRSFEESKEEIKSTLVQKQLPQIFNEWYAEKIEEYDVENNLVDNGEEAEDSEEDSEENSEEE